MAARYSTAHLDSIPAPVEPEPGFWLWRPIRHHFDVRGFGVNAMVAPSKGDWVVEPHTEIQDSGTRHEELYLVLRGHATFEIEGETIDAPIGTLVFVADPAIKRSARAEVDGTTVLAIGNDPSKPYEVSAWEKKYFPDDG